MARNPYRLTCANTINATVVKNVGGLVGSLVALNFNAAIRYVKIYDKNTTPAPASDTPVQVYAIPPAPASGVGVLILPNIDIQVTNGIAFVIVTGLADTDATAPAANDVVLNLGYN